MKSMNTPRTRAEFERNLNLLHRQIKDGKVHIAPGLSRLLDGLARVRSLPNGRIDFLSVDELARLDANMIANMSDGLFEDLKESDVPSEPSPGTEERIAPPIVSDGTADLIG